MNSEQKIKRKYDERIHKNLIKNKKLVNDKIWHILSPKQSAE